MIVPLSEYGEYTELIVKHCMKIYFPNSKQIYIENQFQIKTSIYKFGLSVCLFVSNKRQNG